MNINVTIDEADILSNLLKKAYVRGDVRSIEYGAIEQKIYLARRAATAKKVNRGR